MNDITRLLVGLEHWLKLHRPHFLQTLAPGASVAELASLRSALAGRLPEELASLLAWHNGQRAGAIGYFKERWSLMGSQEIIKATNELQSGPVENRREQHSATMWVPFLDDDEGNYTCIDASKPGGALREMIFNDADPGVRAPSFAAWLADFVAAVERGEYVEDEERGTFVKRFSNGN